MKPRKPNRAQLPASGDSRLRIIGGQWRGRKLPIPELEGLRPTGDRLRETLFNWLMPHLPGARCLDLFAGSGALGLEALSRGAATVTMVELQRKAAAQLRANCTTLGATNANVIEANALVWLASYHGPRFDVVFVDPPFAADLWQQVMRALNDKVATGRALIYVETPRDTPLAVPEDWQLSKHKAMGGVSAHLYSRGAGAD